MSIVLFRVIDLETSGLAPPASVIEIGWCDMHFETETKTVEIGSPQAKLFRPAQKLEPENIAVHHLTNEALDAFPLCTDEFLKSVARADNPQFLVAAQPSFEAQWLTPEILAPPSERQPPRWICTVKAAARLFPDADSHSNQAIRYRLGLDLPEDLAMPPHRAGPDSFVTAHILGRFLQTERVRDLVLWTALPRWMPRLRFGKHKGLAWVECPEDYLSWLLKQPDMDPDVQHWARAELQRRYPRAEDAA